MEHALLNLWDWELNLKQIFAGFSQPSVRQLIIQHENEYLE